MKITYHNPDVTEEFTDVLTTYLSATFPGCIVDIQKGSDYFTVSDVDDLRYLKRATGVIAALIRLSAYVGREYG